MSSDPPSPYRPFLRRFTDERAADLAETQALFERVRRAHANSKWSDGTALHEIYEAAVDNIIARVQLPPSQVASAFDKCIQEVLQLETTLFTTATVDSWHLSMKDQVDLRRFLRAQEHFLAHQDRVRQLLVTALTNLVGGVMASLPTLGNSSTLAVTMCELIPAGDVAERIIGTLCTAQHIDNGIFTELIDQLYRNVCAASGINPDNEGKKQFLTASESDLPPQALIATYLRGTPFHELLSTPVPFEIPLSAYREHGFIFAKSGHGKTQTMRALLADLFEKDCALFVIDGNGALIENLDKVAGISDRVVVLDPDEAPALNFFTMTGGSREKQMELFFYLFKALDQSLTERQATMVSYLVELMQVTPNATLDTLRHALEAPAKGFPYADYFDPLPTVAQDFFNHQFLGNDALVKQTKQQLAQRLYTVSRNTKFAAMFNAPNNTFDAYRLMQERKVVIIDTNRDKLGDSGSAIFGRYILAQCLAAAWQRPKTERHLALIMVDEAKTYLDDQSKKILSDARAFGVGLLLASQFPDQLDDGVRKEVVNNTTIKMAGPAAYSVVSQLNRDMRCDVDFIMSMKKKDYHYAEWACYVDNMTQSAMKLTVPFGAIEKLPQLSDAALRELRRRNKAAYGAQTHEAANISDGSQDVPPPAALQSGPNILHDKVKPQLKQALPKTATQPPLERGDIELDKDH